VEVDDVSHAVVCAEFQLTFAVAVRHRLKQKSLYDQLRAATLIGRNAITMTLVIIGRCTLERLTVQHFSIALHMWHV